MVSDAFSVRPIGFVRSPFSSKVEAPRQSVAAANVTAAIDVLPEFVDALSDLATFERIWVLFWFDRIGNAHHGAKVLPPRSDRKRGVFATRSPHRPNPIGLSSVVLERIEGATLHVKSIDLLDGTPVLDLKPYLAYSDAFPDAGAGWLDPARDPIDPWLVRFDALAITHLEWLRDAGLDFDFRARIEEILALGPQPHAYRRIKKMDDGTSILAVKEWRARFGVEDRCVVVRSVASGFREKELRHGTGEELAIHRAFVARFG